jgi:hypothetical protein
VSHDGRGGEALRRQSRYASFMSAPPYRAPAPRAPKAVVRYYVSGPFTRTGLLLAGLGVLVGSACIYVYVPASEGPPWVFTLLVGGVTWLAITLSALWHARIEVDRSAGTLVLARVLWRIGRNVRTFPLARVKDVVVLDDYDDAPRHMVALIVEGEEPVPLVDGVWVPGEARHEAMAARIRAMLAAPGPS